MNDDDFERHVRAEGARLGLSATGSVRDELSAAADRVEDAGKALDALVLAHTRPGTQKLYAARVERAAALADYADTIDRLKPIGPDARNVGLTLQDMVDVLAALGIQGSDAATSLKTILTRLVPATDKAKNAMRKYGLSFVGNKARVDLKDDDFGRRVLAEAYCLGYLRAGDSPRDEESFGKTMTCALVALRLALRDLWTSVKGVFSEEAP